MLSKHTKYCLLSQISEKLKLQGVTITHVLGIARVKKTDLTKCWWGYEQLEPSKIVVKMRNVAVTFETNIQYHIIKHILILF